MSKNKKILLELLVCIIISLLLIVLKGEMLLFETNDDQTMIDIIAGNFGNSHYYMIYINFALAWFLKGLYSIANQINWYFIFMSINVIIATYALLEVLTVKHNIYKDILVILVISLVLQDLFASFNYTKISGYVAIAGLLSIYDHYEDNNKFYLGIYLTFIASLIRFESFAISLLFFGILMLRKIMKEKKFYQNKRFILLIVFLTIASGLFVGNKLMFKEYNDFNKARTKVIDYTIYNKEALPISDNDYTMLETWTFEDRNVYDTAYFNSLISERSVSLLEVLKTSVLNGIYALKNYPICLLVFIITIISLFDFKHSIMEKIIVIFSFIVVYIILNYLGRIIYRAELLLWLGLLFSLLYYLEISRTVMVGLSVITFIFAYMAKYNEYVDYQGTKQRRDSLIAYTSEHKDNLYLIDTFTSIKFFSPTKAYELMPVGYMDNIMLMGAYTTNHPVMNEMLEKYEISSGMYDCVNNDKCYVIDNRFVENKKIYYKEHYKMEVSFEEVYHCDDFVVYQLLSD